MLIITFLIYKIIHLEGVETVHYVKRFPCYYVKDADGFKSTAKSIVKSKLNEIESFLLYKKEKNDKKGNLL